MLTAGSAARSIVAKGPKDAGSSEENNSSISDDENH